MRRRLAVQHAQDKGLSERQANSSGHAMSRNIAPGSTEGLPGLVLAAGLTQGGLPVSREFVGASESDSALLALGVSVERVLGHLPPPKLG